MENKEYKPSNQDLISIVLTHYNRRDYVIEQLESIAAQTYNNWELIIVDDCSTDKSEEIIQNFINHHRDKKIIFLRNEKNVGVAKNFEKGLLHASGEFIAVCDADDVWFDDKLEKELKFLKSGNYGMVYSDLIVVDAKLNTIKRSFLKDYHSLFGSRKKELFCNLIRENHIAGPTILFKAEFKNKLIPFSANSTQDFWIAIIFSLFSTIGCLEKPTVLYRQHANNMFGVKKISLINIILMKDTIFLKKHFSMKKNELGFLKDLSGVRGINDENMEIVRKKIEATRILLECLSGPVKFGHILKCLAELLRLGAWRDMAQLLYFKIYRIRS